MLRKIITSENLIGENIRIEYYDFATEFRLGLSGGREGRRGIDILS